MSETVPAEIGDALRIDAARDTARLIEQAAQLQSRLLTWTVTTREDCDAILREVKSVEGYVTDLEQRVKNARKRIGEADA